VRNFGYFIFGAIVAVGLLERCNSNSSNENDEKLARTVCGGCHLFPDPVSLPKNHWQNEIFPSMAKFMGRFSSSAARDSMFESGYAGDRVKSAGIFPDKCGITDEQWKRVLDYFIINAPDSIIVPSIIAKQNKGLFKIENPGKATGNPSTTLLKFLPGGNLAYGDAGTGKFIEFLPGFSIKKMGELEKAPVHLIRREKEDVVTVMGSFTPTDAALGMLVSLPRDGKNPPSVIIDKLQRPVHTSITDLDADGTDDYVVCEFGKFTGMLTVFWNDKSGNLVKSVLSPTPGALKTEITDLNADGKPDIIALFGQANERIEAYINQGNRGFKTVNLLSFAPFFGSSSFQLADIDGDGDNDLIYTAGDNADYNPIVKPWHGIYFFENEGNMKFSRKQFFYLPGAYAAYWDDFDLDGVRDLLGVSFFPDWTVALPADCLLWKGGKSGFNKPEQISLSHLGRWIVSDVADIDGDGDSDVILGSLMMEPKPNRNLMNSWLSEKLPFVVMRNQTK